MRNMIILKMENCELYICNGHKIVRNFQIFDTLSFYLKYIYDDMHLVWFSMWDGFFSPRVASRLRRRWDSWFSMWDGFFSPRVASRLRRRWDSETIGEKSISHGKPYKMHFLAYFTFQDIFFFDHAKYTAQSWRSWKPCDMDLSYNCCLRGGNA